jgi:DNA-directed RNA polymerase subunit RPC12/RpoP
LNFEGKERGMSEIEEEREPIVCVGCGWEMEKAYLVAKLTGFDGPEYPHCEVCANTFVPRPKGYPSQYDTASHVILPSLGWIGNRILAEIEALRAEVRGGCGTCSMVCADCGCAWRDHQAIDAVLECGECGHRPCGGNFSSKEERA